MLRAARRLLNSKDDKRLVMACDSTMGEELVKQSATRLAAMIRWREVSPVDVIAAHLERIDALNPRLNAIVTLAPDALAQARVAERALMRGSVKGPLHGLPVTVKDTIDVRGLRATAGSSTRAARVAEEDAPAVARLREAGAIILGKTNCSELALDYTADNPVFGRTVNPYDAARTPGGSSGGCAAAVSSCLTAASLGSDLVGSVRIPAHFCGIVGFRPVGSSVPRGGHWPPVTGAYTLGASIGPLTRTVEDARLMFRVLSGSAHNTEVEDEAAQVLRARVGLRGVRFACDMGASEAPVSDDVRAAVVRAVEACEAVGMVAVDERPPHTVEGVSLWPALFSQATYGFLRGAFENREEDAGPAARALLRRGVDAGRQTLEEFLAAWERRDRMRDELMRWMDRTPVIIAPVGAVPAFLHEESRRVCVAGEAVNTFRAFAQAQVFNVFDMPALAVPAGRTEAGLPVGIQIIARPGDEELLFAVALSIEETTGGWQPPDGFAPHGDANPL